MRHCPALSALTAPWMRPLLSHRLTVERSTLSSLATSDALRYAFIPVSIGSSKRTVNAVLLHVLHVEEYSGTLVL